MEEPPGERRDSHWADTKEMFEPVIVAARYITSLFPTRFRPHRPRFNFILVHYCYMVGMAILISIMLYPAKSWNYIDALFFAAGSATQSGLNTIDVNLLNTYQQVVIAMMTCICTPIFINTAVVFIRLYWFEQRFEHVVKQIREQRRTRPRSITSRSRSQMRGDQTRDRNDDPSQLEAGVNGRRITVLRESLNPGGMNGAPEKADERRRQLLDKLGMDNVIESVNPSPESSRNDSIEEKDRETGSEATTLNQATTREEPRPQAPVALGTPTISFMGLPPRLGREITFADEVPKKEDANGSTTDLAHVPEHRDISKHVEFLERQQNNAKKGGALYIPGPRDFDRGKLPEELDSDMTIQRLHTKTSFNAASDRSPSVDERMQDDDHPRRGITINVPEHPAHRNQRDEDVTESPRRHEDEKSGLRRRGSGKIGERTRSIAQTWTNLTSTMTQSKVEEPMPYFAWSATTGRNSLFLGLTAEQREDLGGIEYRALKTLAKILICYFFGFHILGMMVFLPWILHVQPWKGTVQDIGQSPAWWGVFTPASMFNDLGFTLTPDSMISFQGSVLALLFGSFLIIIGNTGFPCMLRFIIWSVSKMVSRESELWEELRFLLDHPRRCFTLLFPSKATWWLFWVLVLLNGIDLIFFIILDLNQAVVIDLHPGLRVLNGWFQACSTRTAGFASVNLAELHAAIQVSYLIMMYISIFPIAISVRRTNVYEEQSLGIFGGEEEAGDKGDEPSYVSQHLRRQLSFDLWYIFLGVFIIAIVEGDRIANANDAAFTLFSVLFEIVSAYGTVGLSLGYPGINASFSAEFRTISKLIIIAMMIRGRHRGLPYALDRAILLPSEKLQEKEAEESERRMAVARRGSMFAEENANQLGSPGSWEEGDLDAHGLPRQHTVNDAMTAGAGGDHDTEGMRRLHTRRSTAASAKSMAPHGHGHQRVRSLSRVVLGGLSAGPTFSKRD